MTRNDLTITALIPTYNCGHCIGEAIDSVLAQTRPPDEIIVVDDGSTDNTREVVTGYSDKVRYLHKENGGCASARNMGVKAARSEWVALLDSDDLWTETHLEEVCKILEGHPSLAWACSASLLQKGRDGPTRPLTPDKVLDRFVSPSGVIRDYFRSVGAGVHCTTPALVIRKDVFQEVGDFDTGYYRGSDMDMWWRIACKYASIGFARRAGVIVRCFRSDSITTKAADDRVGFCDQLERHIELTRQAGCLDSFRQVAAMFFDATAYQAFYAEDVETLRRIASRHRKLLSPVRRTPICLAAVLPRAGRRMLRRLMLLRLRLLGRKGKGAGPSHSADLV